jgi:hypothetical protein
MQRISDITIRYRYLVPIILCDLQTLLPGVLLTPTDPEHVALSMEVPAGATGPETLPNIK